MGKLTKAQLACLAACPDWAAPYEVTWRRHETTGEIVSTRGTRQALGRLRNLGLVEYGMPNDTYRITEAGCAALASATDAEGRA